MYTVTIGDDGMFSAEYVVPPALSIPLGTSGSAVDVVRNEDGTFSADGEVITAETRVTAENGNVYRAILSPAGVPVGVDHVAAMQDVMLGALGGTVKLTQAEDKSWWLGEMAVMDGYVHTHENGNIYMLMMDAEGMWSAMYQKVEVMVGLGTQGSVTLVRAEDMSWWLGSEAVDVGSEVMSESGNTYTLWYTDGAWSTRFEPESMMIEGTGLVAMTKEDRSGYDVDGADLPSSGMGDIDTSMGNYRVTMTDGMLMGMRLDPVEIKAIYKTSGLAQNPSILPDEDDTEDVNEGMTALVIGGENHPFSALLGSGMSEKQGDNYVSVAKAKLEGIRDQIAALLDALDDNQHATQVARLWGTADNNRSTNVNGELQKVFGVADISDQPNPDKALEEIGKLITALSSVDGLQAALGDDGVFEDLDGGKTASQIFDATKSESSVSYGVTGMTRYGAISKKRRANAVSNPDESATDDSNELGAFAFGVTGLTARAWHVASSGNAYYEGGTLAVDQAGTHYSGDISLRVRFSTEKVDGLITNLVSADGDPWVHVFDAVSSISLPTQDLKSNATWVGSGDATVSYALRAGSTRPATMASSFAGRLLGTGSNAGSEAFGRWSVGADANRSSYLAGGFGATRVADEPDDRPALDDGTDVGAKLLRVLPENTDPAYASNETGEIGQGGDGVTALADGKLTVTVGKFGWTQDSPASDDVPANLNAGHTWERLADNLNTDEDESKLKYEIDLAALVAKGSGEYGLNADRHVDGARTMIEAERKKLAVLIETDQLKSAQMSIWQRVQEILLTRVFNAGLNPDDTDDDAFANRLPDKVNGGYDKDTALETIDQIIWALSSDSNLESALDKHESALFVVQNTDGEDVPFATRPTGDIYSQRELQVRARFGTTDFTRFGVWRVRRNRQAQTAGWIHGEMDTFAYSPLDQSKISSLTAPNYTNGGQATYEGSTVAFVGRINQGWGLVGFEGDVAVSVDWTGSANGDDTLTLGTMTVAISNFAQTENGDPLMHADKPIRELVFSAGNGAGIDITTDGDHKVMFAPDSVTLTVLYEDLAEGVGQVNSTSMLNGVFVGSSSDGPMGVLGRYSIPEGSDMSFNWGANVNTGVDTVRENVSIHGAFGADLP